MWKRYFGPHARIVGIDNYPESKKFEEDQIEIDIGQQQAASFCRALSTRLELPTLSHVVSTFQFLYPLMPKNGIYVVEDLHTAYWEECEGGLRKPSTFIESCKNLIDELNAAHTRGAVAAADFTKSTMSMHFYDSIVVFERGTHTKKFAPMMGATVEKFVHRVKEKLGLANPAL